MSVDEGYYDVHVETEFPFTLKVKVFQHFLFLCIFTSFPTTVRLNLTYTVIHGPWFVTPVELLDVSAEIFTL